MKATPLANPDFAAVDRQFGCEGETVQKKYRVFPAFKRALQCDKPFVIEIQTEPNILSAVQAAK